MVKSVYPPGFRGCDSIAYSVTGKVEVRITLHIAPTRYFGVLLSRGYIRLCIIWPISYIYSLGNPGMKKRTLNVCSDAAVGQPKRQETPSSGWRSFVKRGHGLPPYGLPPSCIPRTGWFPVPNPEGAIPGRCDHGAGG